MVKSEWSFHIFLNINGAKISNNNLDHYSKPTFIQLFYTTIEEDLFNKKRTAIPYSCTGCK